MNTEKHIIDFVDGTPQEIKERYYSLLDKVHAFETAIGVTGIR